MTLKRRLYYIIVSEEMMASLNRGNNTETCEVSVVSKIAFLKHFCDVQCGGPDVCLNA